MFLRNKLLITVLIKILFITKIYSIEINENSNLDFYSSYELKGDYILTSNGDIQVDAIKIKDTSISNIGTINIISNDNVTFTSNVGTEVNYLKTFNISDGKVIFNSDLVLSKIYVKNLNIFSGSSISVVNDILINSNISNLGTINIGSNTLTLNGILNMEIDSSFIGKLKLKSASIINLNDSTNYDEIDGVTSGNGVVNLNGTQTTKATIGGTNKVNEINVASGIITLAEDISANEINLSNGTTLNTGSNNLIGAVSLGDNAIINLDNPTNYDEIDGVTSGDGVVNLNGTQTTKATIGGINKVNEINVTSGIVTLGANTNGITTSLNLNTTLNILDYDVNSNIVNNGLLNINGTGKINGDITGNGDIDFYYSYNALGSVSSKNINISPNSTVTLNDTDSIISGTITLNGHASKIITNKVLTVDTISINTNDNYYDFGINKINTFVDASSGDFNVTNISPPKDTDLVYFTTTSVNDANSSNKIEVVMNYQPVNYNAYKENNLKTYIGAQEVIYNDKEVFNQLNTLNIQGIQNSVSTMNPSTQGVSEYSVNISNQSANIISSHISNIKSSSLKSGISTGDMSLNNMVWGKIYYTQFSQDDEGTISGYDGNGYGFIAGFDRKIDNNQIYGISIGASKGKIESNNTLSNAQTNVNSFHLGLYATQDYKNFTFEEMLLYTLNLNETNRNIVIGGLKRNAQADYNSSLIDFKMGVLYPFYISDLFIIIPKASLSYSYLKTDSYYEIGAGSLNLNVDTKDYVKYTPKINIEIKKDFDLSSGIFSPYLNLGYGVELGDNFVLTNSKFEGGGDTFETRLLNGSDSIFETGLGMSYISDSGLSEFSFDVTNIIKDGYSEQTGMFTSKFRF